MKQHRGSIVEDAVRQSGFSLKKLAERLKISRNTLYNRFKEPQLSYDFILAVGSIIHYDFLADLPELPAIANELEEQSISYLSSSRTEIIKLERKYVCLLERYNKLLSILVKLSHIDELHTIRQEILKFLEENPL